MTIFSRTLQKRQSARTTTNLLRAKKVRKRNIFSLLSLGSLAAKKNVSRG
jgi:hypothetical protein